MNINQAATFNQMSSRFTLDKPNPEDGKNRMKYRYSPEIKYHLPYERLARRKIFGQLIKRYVKDDLLLKMDNFALFDAVAKRGGYQQICAKNRWEEIGICLQYEKKIWGFPKYYLDNLLPFEAELTQTCNWYTKNTFESEVYEMHLLTPYNITTSYYHMTANQFMLAQANFFSLDEYFNIKTLALMNADFSKVSVDYAERYVILRKWLLFSGQVKYNSIRELKSLGIHEKFDSIRVVIVGLSMATLLIADKFSDFGLNVVIFDKGRREGRLKDEFQVVENGLMLLQGGKNKGSYFKHLESSLISLGEINIPNSGMMVLDEDGKPHPQEKIRLSEEHFFGIIQQLKGQIMSKKNLYEEVVTRMIRRKLENERFLIRWHYDRYMTFNRIKGDGTTVGDLATYESKKFIKHIAQSFNLNIVLSLEKLLSKVKEKRNVTILQNSIDHILYQNDTWNIHYRSETVSATHLIYADQQTICRGVLEGNPKLQEVGSQLMGDALTVLQQLTVMKYINCLFRFREKILLKQPLKNQTCFSICCAHGFIYFFVLSSGTQIMAILKCYHTSNINYYSEILNILEMKCLIKNNRLVNEQLSAFEYTFGVKDEKYMESIIRIKQNEKMYLLLPITTTNCPHRMTATIDMANYICGNILDEVYPNYQRHDPAFKDQFLQKIQSVCSSPAFKKSASKDELSVDKEKRKKEKEGSMSNIPVFASTKSMNSQEVSKIKVISVTSNVPAVDAGLRIVEGEIPSVFALSQLQDDWFGLRHSFVKGYQMFVKGRVQSSAKAKEGLNNLHIFSLREPIMLYPGTYLHSLGNPYLKQSEWYFPILSNSPSTPSYIFCLNGFITRRQYISLIDTFRTSIYFQIILIIEDEVYYCIIEESNPSIKYFHKNLTTLMTIFNKKLDTLRNQQLGNGSKSYAHLKITRAKFLMNPSSELLPWRIAQSIKEEIKTLGETSLEDLLEKKFEHSLKHVKYPKFMGTENQILHQNEGNSSNQPIIPSYLRIYKQICEYLDLMIRIYELKHFTLFEIFFGVLNEQYIACEIMKKFTKEPLTYFDLEKLDQPLSKEIQQIFSKNILNELYSIIIIPQEGNVHFHRNFIHPRKQHPFERHTYLRTLQFRGMEPVFRHYLLNEIHKKTQFTSPQDIIVEIIKKLSLHYHQESIIHEFQILINREIQNEANLSPRVKMYYRMTKKSLQQSVNPAAILKFSQKCKDLNAEQKMDAYRLMKSKKMSWIQNQIVYVTK